MPAMRIYRVTQHRIDGTAGESYTLTCRNDDEAIAAAGDSAFPGPMEVHEGERLVAQIPPLSQANDWRTPA